MARTSNRRWKGCAMCKGHKFAQQGDRYRIPRRALKQYPTGNGKRVNRHDVGLWDGGVTC